MNKILDALLPLLFERFPGLRKFNGYKRTIGNLLMVLAATLAAVQQYFPETPYVATAIAIIGAVIRVLGDLHADSKGRRFP